VARNSGNNIFGWFVLVAVTIAGGAALGYYVIAGSHTGHSTGTPIGVQQASAPPPTPVPDSSPRPLVHVRPNSDYTAPGAPHIHIVENQTPTLGSPNPTSLPTQTTQVKTSTDNIPTPDAEASQEAATDSLSTTTSDTSASPIASSSAASSSVQSPSAPNPNAAPSPDAEESQAAPPLPPAPSHSSTQAQYRIQAGSFSKAQDAQTYMNTLQGKGIAASLSTERQSGQTVYHVQVGAYHDHAAAEVAASGFRTQGVPVTVTAISP
jgi:cell division protein FtsN